MLYLERVEHDVSHSLSVYGSTHVLWKKCTLFSMIVLVQFIRKDYEAIETTSKASRLAEEFVKISRNRTGYHARVRTDRGYRELPATMDENDCTRIRAMIRNVRPGIGAVATPCGPNNLEFRK